MERSENMRRIPNTGTRPEIILRKQLYSNGFRYRINKKIQGFRPDLVLQKYNAVIFVHGCFWHAHDCKNFRLSKTRTSFWKKKFLTNVERDRRVTRSMIDLGWRICIVWECRIRRVPTSTLEKTVDTISRWIKGEEIFFSYPDRKIFYKK